MLRPLLRMLQRSILHRGTISTVGFILEMTFDRRTWIRVFNRDGDAEFDANFTIETKASLLQGELLDIASPNWVHGSFYNPTPVEIFREMLSALPIRHEDFTFIDYGSGKGRVLLLASELPFKEIIGIEFSKHLHQIALRNVASYSSETQACKRIHCLFMDATAYDIPLVPAVCYFFNPFREPVMAEVVRRLEASLETAPRQIFVLYFSPLCEEVFRSSRYFREFRSTQGYAIYQSAVATESIACRS